MDHPTLRLRLEIQALRAVAVGGVVVFHFWPALLPGGYVGVDVFFVISGFLITSHLVREHFETGRIRLSQFYARRIRRLLPAALLVLAVSAVGILLLSAVDEVRGFLSDVVASALYVVNWTLAAQSVDYFSSDDAPSPVQHYWSLSVEEQFYIVWPLLLVLAFALAAKLRRGALPVVTAAMAVVFVSSFVFSVLVTAATPDFAYFATPSHGWEFAAGGLLAVFAARIDRRVAPRRRSRAVLGWVGGALIAVPMVVFDAQTAFPGWIAVIPVLGVLAVIVAGMPEPRWSFRPIAGWRPVQWVGDQSYAIYLWHWPVIVFAGVIAGGDVPLEVKLGLLALVVVLAWLTRRFIERPVIASRLMRRRAMSFAAAALAMAIVAGGAQAAVATLDARAEQTQAEVAETLEVQEEAPALSCVGASAIWPEEHDCAYAYDVDPALMGDPLNFESAGLTVPGECTDGGITLECRLGSDDPTTTLALVGDSHAEAMLPALEYQLSQNDDWALVVNVRRSCLVVDPAWRAPADSDERQNEADCVAWREQVVADVAADPEVDAVVVTGYSHRYNELGDDVNQGLAAAFGWTLRTWDGAGKRVLVIGDVPLGIDDVYGCVAAGDPEVDCSSPRAEVLPRDPFAEAVGMVASRDVELVDLTDAFCDETRCYTAIGGLMVYADPHHITGAFSATLGPMLQPAVEALVAR